MFRKSLVFVWISILSLSGMFLMGQESWSPQECVDTDGDGYGNPASASCPRPQLDCDDTNPEVHAGALEASYGAPVCRDGLDNDCDGKTDLQDNGCQQCNVPAMCNDGNPCTDEDCVNYVCVYTNNTKPCDDGDECTTRDVCQSGVCTGEPLDQDGDGYQSEACGGGDCDDLRANVYPGAQELCDGVDNDCDGVMDDMCSGLMVDIPAGCFDMGDSFNEGNNDERPVHNVCISAFKMDVYEVTNAEYAECVAAGACTPPSNYSSYSRSSYYGNPAYADFPVIYVDWHQATAYCAWAGKRLPTEAEWEYAARGGLARKRYPWGDTISGSNANYWNSGDPWDNDTSPVGHYLANGYGLYDMAGNVFEWVNDWFSSTYYQYCVDNGIVNNPPGPATGTSRVQRGGSWLTNNVFYLRVAFRGSVSPTSKYYNRGFRCAQ